MLVWLRRILDAVLMNVDSQIDVQGEEHQAGDSASAGKVAAGLLTSPATIAPPPPSAPSEFLAAQWLQPLPAPRAHRKFSDTLTPPPPSAPGEFLTAQWWDGPLPDKSPRDVDLAIFHTALSESIDSADQLELLTETRGAGVGLPSGAIGEPADAGVEMEPHRIRGVPLAHAEDIALAFLPDEGLVKVVPTSGQALILTSRRLIAFRGVEGFRDTHMALASGITQCSVRTGQRNWNAIMQGLMIMVGGAVLYLIVGYWLAGRVSGPNVPVLNIDVAPLIALLIVLAGIFILASNYFTRPAGAMIFHGEGVEIAFPFRSSLDLQQVYDFVDRVHLERKGPMDSGTRNHSGG